MATTIANLRNVQAAGIWADRDNKSPSLTFRRYNLIYGFNGSGKSTLSRLFACLEAGAPHPRLPEGCSFTIEMDDNTTYGCPISPNGLERRILVFNADYVEKNLQWAVGRANPVFFIGAEQADAVAELNKIELKIAEKKSQLARFEADVRAADKIFTNFKRDRAKITASHLRLGNRKYEAPALAKDFENWSEDQARLLTQDKLEAAKASRSQAEPLAELSPINFDAKNVANAFAFVSEICSQSLSIIALGEAQKFPDMLIWLKEGYVFQHDHSDEPCLLCGNRITTERMAMLSSALDNKIDQFIEKLSRTASRLSGLLSELSQIIEDLPAWDAVESELRSKFKAERETVIAASRKARECLSELKDLVAEKQSRPAAPVEIMEIQNLENVADIENSLRAALVSFNDTIAAHNLAVKDFTSRKERAELNLRKHFIAECRSDYSKHEKSLEKATSNLERVRKELSGSEEELSILMRLIRVHGPAASVINSLIASYLGHDELTINPVEQGYELHRHKKAISGLPSEGEKTAIAIAYFLSSIEAEGRKLKDTIICIDDPVSSLDTKALNFACALVRSRVEGAAQVFILTHNLQCMNEFKKSWKNRARKAEENNGKIPTAAFYFIDVKISKDSSKRRSSLAVMSKLLREYDSEYHYLFSHIVNFDKSENHYEYSYMMPNVLRRVLDVFLAFKCPGSSGLVGQIAKICADYPNLDKNRLIALERLVQSESHSDNLDDLLTFSNMTVEETKSATQTLLYAMEVVDEGHLKALKRLCA